MCMKGDLLLSLQLGLPAEVQLCSVSLLLCLVSACGSAAYSGQGQALLCRISGHGSAFLQFPPSFAALNMPLLVDACSMKLLEGANIPSFHIMQTLFGGG